MSIKILRPCNYPFCHKYAEQGGYCMEHYQLRERTRQKSSKRKRYKGAIAYNNNRWSRARISYLMNNPVCAICGKPATEIDHIIPHKGDYELFWNVDNWQPLCHSCHSRKTVLEDGGFGNKTKDSQS